MSPVSSVSPVSCSQHPASPAAWRCLGCARALCPECAELLEVGSGVEVVGCRACGGNAPPLRVSGREEAFVASLRGLFRMPVTALGFAGLWLLAVVGGTVARRAGAWALLAWSAPMWVAAFVLLRATAERGTVGRTVRVSLGPDLLGPAARGLILGAPAVLWGEQLGNGWATALAVGAGLCAPEVLARLASGAGIAGAVDPRWLVRAWRKTGADAAIAGLASTAVLLFARLLWATAGSAEAEVPALWVEVTTTLAAFSLFLVPQLSGLLVRAHAEALEFELESRGERLASPGAVPAHRRTVAPAVTATTAPRSREALELTDPGPGGRLELEPLAGGGRDPDDGR